MSAKAKKVKKPKKAKLTPEKRRKKTWKLTLDQKWDLAERYRDGEAVKALAVAYDVSESAIVQIAHSYGFRRRRVVQLAFRFGVSRRPRNHKSGA